MSRMDEIITAKVRQAIGLLREFNVPAWIAQFGRETHEHPEPVQRLVVGTSVTWPAAFVIAADGSATAIVGTGDVANVRDVGAYPEVIGYVRDVGPPLRELLARLNPSSVGVSYSRSDDSADCISHGMYLLLEECLRGTAWVTALTPADGVLAALRARKLLIEVERIKRAVGITLRLCDSIETLLQDGVTERKLYLAVHEMMREAGVTTAWDERYDPVVNFGPASKFGHAGPGDHELQPGMLVHVDLGIKVDGYCSDLQRMWYVLRDGELGPPPEVEHPFRAVLASLRAGIQALKPSAAGWEVDLAARRILTAEGFDEPEFALGHQLGQFCHDGGALLGPRWPRYGVRPSMKIESDNVFTIEFGLQTPAGIIGLEEDVLVTSGGAEYLSAPQTELRCVRL
jgi:Xaa-Pro aminopeptidase